MNFQIQVNTPSTYTPPSEVIPPPCSPAPAAASTPSAAADAGVDGVEKMAMIRFSREVPRSLRNKMCKCANKVGSGKLVDWILRVAEHATEVQRCGKCGGETTVAGRCVSCGLREDLRIERERREAVEARLARIESEQAETVEDMLMPWDR